MKLFVFVRGDAGGNVSVTKKKIFSDKGDKRHRILLLAILLITIFTAVWAMDWPRVLVYEGISEGIRRQRRM